MFGSVVCQLRSVALSSAHFMHNTVFTIEFVRGVVLIALTFIHFHAINELLFIVTFIVCAFALPLVAIFD